MSLFASATTLHRETSRGLQTGFGQRGGMSPSAAELLSQLKQTLTGVVQAAGGAKTAASALTHSDDSGLSSVFASLEADLADLVSGLRATRAGAAGETAASGLSTRRASLHDLLQALDADSAGGPAAPAKPALG